jgi:hypothetical protein
MMLINPFFFSDPALTVMLLHFDGTNGSTTFTDSSTYAATFTRTGSPTIQDNMGEFIADGYYIKAPQPVAGLWEWGANDFEITGEFKINSVGGYRGIICQRNVLGTAGTFALFIDKDSSNKLRFQVGTSGGNKSVIHQTAPAANTLYTFKAERHGAYLRLWLNDVESTTPAYIGSETIPPDVTDITIGVVLGSLYYHTLGGRVDKLKIVKFTPV